MGRTQVVQRLEAQGQVTKSKMTSSRPIKRRTTKDSPPTYGQPLFELAKD